VAPSKGNGRAADRYRLGHDWVPAMVLNVQSGLVAMYESICRKHRFRNAALSRAAKLFGAMANVPDWLAKSSRGWDEGNEEEESGPNRSLHRSGKTTCASELRAYAIGLLKTRNRKGVAPVCDDTSVQLANSRACWASALYGIICSFTAARPRAHRVREPPYAHSNGLRVVPSDEVGVRRLELWVKTRKRYGFTVEDTLPR
jgi:hypothetical protein